MIGTSGIGLYPASVRNPSAGKHGYDDGEAVVFRTASGTKLEAISRALVAFEVDRLSSPRPWTVTVKGLAQEITSADGPGLRERLTALHVQPWATGDRLHYVRILADSITGRRLR